VPVWADRVIIELFRPWLAIVRKVSTVGFDTAGGTLASGPRG
jgi:hypothetical protein